MSLFNTWIKKKSLQVKCQENSGCHVSFLGSEEPEYSTFK